MPFEYLTDPDAVIEEHGVIYLIHAISDAECSVSGVIRLHEVGYRYQTASLHLLL